MKEGKGGGCAEGFRNIWRKVFFSLYLFGQNKQRNCPKKVVKYKGAVFELEKKKSERLRGGGVEGWGGKTDVALA